MKNYYAYLKFVPLLGLLATPYLQASDAAEQAWQTGNYNLMLAGGSINLCSSMSLRNCKTPDWVDADMRQTRYFSLSEARLSALAEALKRGSIEHDSNAIMKHLAAIVKENNNETSVRQGRFNSLFDDLKSPDLGYLDDHTWYMITDYLELPQAQLEVVNFNQAAEPYGREIITSFVDMARHARSNRETTNASADSPPRILVVTASARDSYEAINFYHSAFAAAGARPQWLPIDAPMHHAMQAEACDQLAQFQAQVSRTFDRQRVYPNFWQAQMTACNNPQSILDLIAEADGVFINGGDQSLTRQAFVTEQNAATPWLAAIQQRLQAGTLAVGGTSAGSAVQPASAMISNGSSYAAILQRAKDVPPPERDCELTDSCGKGMRPSTLTYNSAGGIALYPFGLVDTHFSERHRQARIMALGADTNTSQATGVDETTALTINTRTGAFEVVGRHGVFFARDMHRRSFWGRSVEGVATYLLSGSRGRLGEDGPQDIVFAEHPPVRARLYRNELSSGLYFVEGLDQWCAGGSDRFEGNSIKMRLKPTQATRAQAHEHGCQVVNLPVSFSL